MERQHIPLALDFDGVLCDSDAECLVASWNAWLDLTRQGGRVRAPTEVPADVAAHIRTFRCYVKTPGEYLPVVRTGVQRRPITGQADYDALLAQCGPETAVFSRLFLAARAALRSQDAEGWLKLHRSYDGVAEGLRAVGERFKVFIVTGKDRSSVEQFLAFAKIEGVPAERILDHEEAANKFDLVKRVATACRVALEDLFMLDDNVMHLMAPQGAGCQVFLAGWGYHTDEHLALARERRIPILELGRWAEALIERQAAVVKRRMQSCTTTI